MRGCVGGEGVWEERVCEMRWWWDEMVYGFRFVRDTESDTRTFSGFSFSCCINEREGYLLPTLILLFQTSIMANQPSRGTRCILGRQYRRLGKIK